MGCFSLDIIALIFIKKLLNRVLLVHGCHTEKLHGAADTSNFCVIIVSSSKRKFCQIEGRDLLVILFVFV